MSQKKYNASRSSKDLVEMFPKDVSFNQGDSEYLQTKSLSPAQCLFHGQQGQPNQVVCTYLKASSQGNVHLYQSCTSIPSQALSTLNQYQKEKVLQFPVVVQDDDWMLPTEPNQLHHQCQILSPHAILGPQEILTSSQGTKPMISQFISINGNQEGFKKLECDQESETIPSDNLLISTTQDDSSQPNPKQKKGRYNDSNNADKKVITVLFDCQTALQKKEWKARIASAKTKHNIQLKVAKSSRYGFTQSLISLKHFFGRQYIQNLFQAFIVKLAQFAQEIKSKPESTANDYLLTLPQFYIESYLLFLSGSIKDSIEALYNKRENFRQNQYMAQGIKKVQKLEKDLESLEK